MRKTRWTRLGTRACLITILAWPVADVAARQHAHTDAPPGAGGGGVGGIQATESRPVKFKGAERELTGALFQPKGRGPFPAVINLHGINGVSDWDREVARKLAAEGYATLVVDLFGRTPVDYGDGLRLRDRFRPRVPDDLRAAVAYLKTLETVRPDRIGVIGWCMGGGYALLLAVAEPTLAASVIYYGPTVPPPGPTTEELDQINAPIIAFFGQEDASLPIPQVKMFANNLREKGKHIELHIYPDAGHGFAERQTRPPTHGEAMAPDPAADSWQKTLTFLKTHLQKS